MSFAAHFLLYVLAVNGLRATIGVPPVSYWFRSRICKCCSGVGFVRTTSTTANRVRSKNTDLDYVEIPSSPGGERQ